MALPEGFTNWSDYINSFNPEADPAKPYVQAGQTGGYLEGVGVTQGAGSSVTPDRAAAAKADAIAQYGQAAIDWEQRNPNDWTRATEALSSERSGGGGGDSPTQAWNSQPASGGTTSQNALISLLMQRAQQGTTVDRNSSNVRMQVDPFRAQLDRANREYLDTLAERSGPLANLQGERRLAAERTGQQAGTLEAQVIGREIDAKRTEIMQALSLWGDQLSEQQRLDLQKELAYLDDATRRYGIDTSQDQFLRDLALREYDTVNRWDPTNPINIP